MLLKSYHQPVVWRLVAAAFLAGGFLLSQKLHGENLINVNFYAHQSGGASDLKVGLAATGQTASDFWNHYSRDDGSGGFRTFGVLNNLKWADGTSSAAGLTVANAPGAWLNASSDVMYKVFLYPFGGNATITLTNLPVGRYDLYLYGHDANYQMTVGGTSYGLKATYDNPIVNPPVWQEGKQYALFRNVQVSSAGQAVTVTVSPGVGGYAVISGMQILAAAPDAPTGLTATAGDGQVSLSWNASPGAANYVVKHSMASGGPYNTVATVNGLSYVNTGLANGVAHYYVVSAVGPGGESLNSTSVSATPAGPSPKLLNVNFYAHQSGGANAVKVGLAATGQTASDFWNHYSRDDGSGNYLSFGVVSNLKWADGTSSGAGLTVANAPGAWVNGSADAMYNVFLYPFGGNATITLTDLPMGQYDLYLYGHDANYQVTVGGTSYGLKATYDNPIVNPPVWQEGKQYALFRNVQVSSAGQAVTVTVSPGVGGYAVISGMQILSAVPATPPPDAPTGLAATAGNAQVSLGWNASTGATNYNVKRSAVNGGPYSIIATVTGQSYVNTALANGLTYHYVVSAVGQGGESTNSTSVSATPVAPLPKLLNVNFHAHLSPGAGTNKVGLAATGQTANDYWNHYSRDDGSGNYLTFGVLSNLKWADGTSSSAGLTIANAPGAYPNGSSDAMYNIFLYSLNGGNVTVTVTNLPIGEYDLYLYGQDGNYQVTAGGTNYGVKTSSDPAIVNPPVWQEGKQYALFKGVRVSSLGQTVVVTVRPGAGGYTIISGMQIATASTQLLAPNIISQPESRTVPAGANVTFRVIANGTPPLSYQWRFNETNIIAGATNAFLTVSNVQFSQSGRYSVKVTNPVGSTTSSNALLSVNFLPAAVRVARTSAMAGGLVSVPIILVANGNENALGFSLNFNTQRLTFAGITLGNGAGGGTVLENTGQAVAGRLGIAVAMPSGASFAPGTQEVVRVNFTSPVLLESRSVVTTLTFGDQPTSRQLSDIQAHALSATYANGSVTLLPSDLEGDTAPRPAGDRALTITDWVQVGRFVAGLDTPSNGSEFQRADCAPRASLGDGMLKVTDWVQAGRYAVRLDPLTAVGGPNSPVAGTSSAQRGGISVASANRQVSVGGATAILGLAVTLPLNLQSQGDESALGLSLVFDPAAFTFSGVSLGNGAAGATLNVNTSQVSSGKLGLAVALPTGKFTAGSQEVAKVSLIPTTSTAGNYSLSFGDQPVARGVSDPTANELTAAYIAGSISVKPLPPLKITRTDENVTLSWPIWAEGFNLQTRTSNLLPPGNWTNIVTTLQTNGADITVTLPVSEETKFFRLHHP